MAYALGLVASLLVALAGQGLLHKVAAGTQPASSVQDIGYAFTGLSLLGAFGLWRLGRGALAASALKASPALARTVYLWFAAASLVALGFGLLYWGMGGAAVERHARTYIALGPLAYLLLAPRPRRWTAGRGDPA